MAPKLLIINPNSTEAMTESILASARAAAPAAQIDALTSHEGPPAIEGPEDGARAKVPLLRLIAKANQVDAIIIACFDDTGLEEAKALAPVPVIGIGEAAYAAAQLLGKRFCVVTTLAVSVPIIEANIHSTGFAHLCTGVRASDVPVLALEHHPAASVEAVAREAERALIEDDPGAIVLGCAGMTGLRARLAHLPVAIIDGVTSATHLALAASAIGKAD